MRRILFITSFLFCYAAATFATALPSLSPGVPYTGAYTNLDLGSYNFTTTGKVTTGTLKVTTGASAGYIGVSDADGDFAWTNPTGMTVGTATNADTLDTLHAASFGQLAMQNRWALTQDFGNGAAAGGEIHIMEDSDNGSNYIALKGQDTLAGNFTYTFAAVTGTVPTLENANSWTLAQTVPSLILSANTSSATDGIIFKASDPILHTYNHATATGRNTFLGLFSGNTTMSPGGGAADLSSYLTGLGYHTLLSVTTGYNLTAAGAGAMQQATTSVGSSAFGVHSLYSLTEGFSDNAFGHYAGYATVGGDYNNYFGENAGYSNVSGNGNLAAGHNSLYTATDDDYNTALGMEALKLATLGNNTAAGAYSLAGVGAGYDHSALGVSAGRTVTGGNTSSFFGFNAGYHASQKVDPVNSTAIGNGSYTTADNQVVIGNANVTETQLHGNIYGDNFIPDKYTADAPRPSGWPQTTANANDHEFTGETLMLTGTCDVVHHAEGTSTVTSTAGAAFDAGDDGKYLVIGNAAFVIDSVTSTSIVEVTNVDATPADSTGTAYRVQRTGYWLFYDATHVTGGAVEPSTFNQTSLPGYFTAANGGSVSAGFFMEDNALGTADFTYTIKMAQPSYGSYCALAFTDASNDGNCFGMYWNGHFDTFRSTITDFAITSGTYTQITAYSYFQYIQVRRRSNAISLAGSPDGVTWVMILGEGTVTMANDITKVGVYYSTAAAAYPSPASISVDFIRKQ